MATAFNLIKNTAKAGNTVLGVGCYSAVLIKKSNEAQVIKIGTCMEDPWLTYYHDIIAHNQDNPFVPKVYSFRQFDDYYIAIMEHLEPAINDEGECVRDYMHGNVDWSEADFIDCFIGYGYSTKECNQLLDLVTKIHELTDCYTEEDCNHVETVHSEEIWGYNKLDLHHNNFMTRDGMKLVIIDPWCNVNVEDVPSAEDWYERRESKEWRRIEN